MVSKRTRRKTSRRKQRRKVTHKMKRTRRALAGLAANIFGSPKKVEKSLDKISAKINGKLRVESDLKTWKCILCNDMGHTWRDCPKFADKKILKTIHGKDNVTVKDKDGNKLKRLRYDDKFFEENIKAHLPDNFVPPRKKTKRKRKKSAPAAL